jgi:hypothetical protein
MDTSVLLIPAHIKKTFDVSSMVPGVVWLDVQVIYLQNPGYCLTSAGYETYIAGLHCLCIKPHISYLWCGAECRDSSVSVKPCFSSFRDMQWLRLEVQIVAVYKTKYFLPFASCEACVRARILRLWSTGCMHPSYCFCAAQKKGKAEIT